MKAKLHLVVALVIGIGLGVGGLKLLSGYSHADPACTAPVAGSQSYQVMIMNDKVEPSQITARLCDSLTITNMDKIAREIAFGPHEHHVPYDGVAERVLNRNQSLTITLNQAGNFHWHDHLHDEVRGNFTVAQ